MSDIAKDDPRYLTGTQQHLLRAALSSNQSRPIPQSGSVEEAMAAAGAFLDSSPSQPSSGNPKDFSLDENDLTEFLDGYTSFLNSSEFNGLYPQDLDAPEAHDKRRLLEDEDDLDNPVKRQEGDDKQAKKPGRKPLTSEPTTKRKAQNRAAQRAFRERKEKHLKDLETKVTELTKSAEATSQENGVLRAQVARLQSELKEYRKRMATDSNRTRSSSTQNAGGFGNEFAFDFPAFGIVPNGPSFSNSIGDKTVIKKEGSHSPNEALPKSRHNSASRSPHKTTGESASRLKENDAPSRSSTQGSNGLQNFAGLFSPALLNSAASGSDYGFPGQSASPTAASQAAGTDTNSGISRVFRFNSESCGSNTDSPSQSSMSQFNVTSSCDTSPGPSHPSPQKDNNTPANSGLTMNDRSYTNSMSSTSPLNGTNWLASQNGGQFDPVLFGDYRESQDAIVGDGEFNNGFFNDAFPFAFSSPGQFDVNPPKTAANILPNGQTQRSSTTPNAVKNAVDTKSDACEQLLAEVERASAGGGDDFGLPCNLNSAATDLHGTDSSSMLSANTIWKQLQKNKDFQDGKFDLDALCGELRTKAKCSESGVVIPATDVDSAFKKLSSTPAHCDGQMVFDRTNVDDAFRAMGAQRVNWGGMGL